MLRAGSVVGRYSPFLLRSLSHPSTTWIAIRYPSARRQAVIVTRQTHPELDGRELGRQDRRPTPLRSTHPSRVTHATLSPDGEAVSGHRLRRFIRAGVGCGVRTQGRREETARHRSAGSRHSALTAPISAAAIASRVEVIRSGPFRPSVDRSRPWLGHRARDHLCRLPVRTGSRIITITTISMPIWARPRFEGGPQRHLPSISRTRRGTPTQEAITHAAFSADGGLPPVTLVTTTQPASGMSKRQPLRRELQESHGGCEQLSLPAADFVAATGKDRMAIVWDAEYGPVRTQSSHKAGVVTRFQPRLSLPSATACRDGAFSHLVDQEWTLVDLQAQPGDARFVASLASIVGRRSASSREFSSAIRRSRPQDPQQLAITGRHRGPQVGLGVWDFSPGREPPVEPLQRIGEAIAARRIAGEVEMIPITPEDSKDDWSRMARQRAASLATALALYEWHNRVTSITKDEGTMVVLSRWSVSVSTKDLLNTYARKARLCGARPQGSSAQRVEPRPGSQRASSRPVGRPNRGAFL